MLTFVSLSVLQSHLAIAVSLAVSHFVYIQYYGPVHLALFKYIYPKESEEWDDE